MSPLYSLVSIEASPAPAQALLLLDVQSISAVYRLFDYTIRQKRATNGETSRPHGTRARHGDRRETTSPVHAATRERGTHTHRAPAPSLSHRARNADKRVFLVIHATGANHRGVASAAPADDVIDSEKKNNIALLTSHQQLTMGSLLHLLLGSVWDG